MDQQYNTIVKHIPNIQTVHLWSWLMPSA